MRVGQAMRLLADRPGLIHGALAGFASPANNCPGYGCRTSLHSSTERETRSRGRHLLKRARYPNLTVTLGISGVSSPSASH